MILATSAAFYLVCGSLLAGAAPAAEYDPYTGAEEVLRFSFDEDPARGYDGDRDYDGQPDGWTRRKGAGFPDYVLTTIDRGIATHGTGSLRFDANGGKVALYSPMNAQVGLVDGLHSYVFSAAIRTQTLQHDAAVISVSFLNYKRQRLERHLTRPVSGTHLGWQIVKIGPITPHRETRFVVIGCHLVQGEMMDIGGQAWFDNLWLGRLPKMSLENNFSTHFREHSTSSEITAHVNGLDAGHEYSLEMELRDAADRVIAEQIVPLASDAPPTTDPSESVERAPVRWSPNRPEYGFYRATAALKRSGVAIIRNETTFAVMDLIETGPNDKDDQGEFGWSIGTPPKSLSATDLVDIAAQAGINRLKYPLWRHADSDDLEQSTHISRMLELLLGRGIAPIGILGEPPAEMRSKFAKNWAGVSEIFMMPASFWSPSVQSILAKYSTSIRQWQLGDESDFSFVGMENLPQALANVKREFDRIGRHTQIGVVWDSDSALPVQSSSSQLFYSLARRKETESAETFDELRSKLDKVEPPEIPRWVLLKPLSKSRHSTEERGADLVKRMVAAKIAGAEAIFAIDVFDEEHGLMRPEGAPTPLFLPWRTTALALRRAEFLGSLTLPGGSRNYLFARDGQVVMIAWNDAPLVEEVYLGHQVMISDVLGRKLPAVRNPENGYQRIPVGVAPVIVHGCSEAICRWSLAVRFERGKLPSSSGRHRDSIIGQNSFSQGVNGVATLNLPKDWEVEPRSWSFPLAVGEKFQLPTTLTLPPNVGLGEQSVSIDFEIEAEEKHRFRVYRQYEVGLGDVVIRVVDSKLPDGRLKIDQTILNATDPAETLDFDCSLFVPGNKRQKSSVTRLGRGKNLKIYHLPNADSLLGQELQIRAEQIGGSRVMTYRWTVGESWNAEK